MAVDVPCPPRAPLLTKMRSDEITGRPLPSPGPESIAVSMRTAPGPDVSRGRGYRAPYAAGCRPPRGPGVLLRSLWTRGGTSPQPGNTGPARARVRGVRCLSSHSGSWLAGARQAAAPVSVPHMALSFSIMLERLEGSAAVMASWRERIKRRYTP